MTVRDYYTKHFTKLTPEAQLHYATTLKNWFNTSEFADFLKSHQPSSDLAELYHHPQNHKFTNYELKKPYLKKYKNLYNLKLTLARVHLLQTEYDTDLRRDLLKLLPRDQLYDLSDSLLSDDVALTTLSAHAVDVICLIETLFPRKKNPTALLAQTILHFSGDPALQVHLATHIIICDTNFYTRQLTTANLPIYRPLIARCATLINQNLITIPLDTKLEFLVASKILNAAENPSVNATKNRPTTWPQAPTGYLPLTQKISIECQTNLRKSPFLLDPRKPDQNDFSTAEPRNTLYILSGLDAA